ncbi:MAG: hypothetical protein JOZ69_04915 [Myxococcales bacterium]|nr:hypothetical protein [Myxococcales bacterium]
MNRWIRRTVASVSFLGAALALVPAGIALAHEGSPSSQGGDGGGHHGRGHREGLLRQALELDSLTADQRTAIEGLIQQRHDAQAPVRSADAQLLTALAQQVEQASIDTQALTPALQAENGAAAAASSVERDTLNRLHGILTPAQRNQLVDGIEAKFAHRRGPSGRDGGAEKGHGWGLGGRFEGLREKAAKLGLSQDQKAQIAANLRNERGDGGGPSREDFMAHMKERHDALESFRGDSFDASALVRVERRGEFAEKLAKAMVPVLNPSQRSTLAGELRARAAHESGS